MCASPSICQRLVTLVVLLLGGVVIAEDAARRKPGLYDGAVGGHLAEVVDQSLLLRNPVNMKDVPLRQAMARIEQMTHWQVWIDKQAISDAGVILEEDTTITLWPAGETVLQLTNHLEDLTQTEFAWEVHGGIATLSTAEKVNERYQSKQYAVGDLLAQGLEADRLMELLQQETSGPWEAEEPGTGTIHAFGNLLFVRQTSRVQHEIAEMLAILRRQDPIVIRDSSDEDVRVRRTLEEKLVSVDWPGVPLGEFAQGLTELTGIQFRLDDQALKDSGIDQDTRLDARAVNVPLSLALQKNLENVNDVELTVRVSDEACHITTAEKAREQYETIFYRLESWGITGGDLDEIAALLELETSGPWDRDEPGTGTISVVEPLNMLVIRQTYRVQQEILEMLLEMRSKLAKPKPGASQAARPATPIGEPRQTVHIVQPNPDPTETLAPSSGPPFAAVTWETIGDYAPLLLALLLGCATGYLCRH